MLFSKDKKANRSLIGRAAFVAVLFIAVLFAVMLGMRLNSSLGWFASNLDVSASGLSVSAANEQYIFYIQRTTEYDETIAVEVNGETHNKPKYDGIEYLKNKLNSPQYNYDIIKTSTRSASKLAFEMVSEVPTVKDGTNYFYLMPGAHGTVTFYFKSKTATDNLIANMELSLGCFTDTYEIVDDNYVKTVTEITDDNILKLLKGHIMFFTGREGEEGDGNGGYVYSGLIDDGMIRYNTNSAETYTVHDVDEGDVTGCYKITLYWEWPLTYSSIVENISDDNVTRRYPSEVSDYISDHADYFFAINQNSSDIVELNDGYNEGDQIIGENADYIISFIVPH